MKLVSFSNALCQQLLDMGYTYFVIPDGSAEGTENENIHIFEAVRSRPLAKSVSIKHIMDLPEDTAKRYFVMYKEA